MNIAIDRSLRLPETQFVNQPTDKKRICLHFTAGGSAAGAINWWLQTKERVATPFVVDTNGRIFECFDPACWAWHMGVEERLERETIGIEIANWGPLKLQGDTLFTPTAVPRPLCKISDTGRYVFVEQAFRGQHYFAAFPSAQLAAVAGLVDYCCDRWIIPRATPPAEVRAEFNIEWARNWHGIFSHQNVRKDKCDIGPAFDWGALATLGGSGVR